MQTIFLAAGWQAAGHGVDWLDRASEIAAWLAAIALGILIVRAIIRHARQPAVGRLSRGEMDALRAEIAKAELQTVGEIQVVVLECSDDHPQGDWLAALCTLLVGAILSSAYFDTAHPSLWLALLLASGALGFTLARALPDFKRNFVGDKRAQETVEEQALQEFARLGVHLTSERSGVLILVSVFERMAVVLADEGIHSRTSAATWHDADSAIVAGVQGGSLAEGLRKGIEAVAAVLAEHHPRRGELVNELPDHLIVRRK